MAISTQRSLSELAQECKQLGLDVKPKGKKLGKTDYVLALRDYHMKRNYPNGIPLSLNLMLQLESPMLCKQYKSCKPQEQTDIWDSKQWILQEKMDGNRNLVICDGTNLDYYSRNISVEDYLPVCYSDNVWDDFVDKSQITHSFILDSEVICSNPHISTIMGNKGVLIETQLQATSALMAMNPEDSVKIQREQDAKLMFYTFDCIYFDGEWLIDKPLLERMKYLKIVMKELQEAGFMCKQPQSNISNKKAFYEYIIKSGGEGCIAKNIMAPYLPSSSRSRSTWVKLKRTVSETSGMESMGDTIDAFITGFEPADEDKSWKGLVGALILSVIVEKEDGTTYTHEIAKVSNITLEERRAMTELDSEGKPKLKQEYYGKVYEVDGQAISARAMRLKHAILVRERKDKNAENCTMLESFLKANIL